MNRGSSPGLAQWLTVSIMVVGVIFIFFKLYQYSLFRGFYPAGLDVAGVEVGGMTKEEASQVLTDRYMNAPVTVLHGEDSVQINPLDAEFQLDLPAMLADADYQQAQQDFWSGFWGFLWNRPVEVAPVALQATHDREALREVLKVIQTRLDKPALPPQPVPASLSFQYGEPGTRTDIEASLQEVENAFYRAVDRQARLVIEPLPPPRPDINLLARLMVNHVQGFEGTASLFVMDLKTGEEISYQADVAVTGMDMLKLPLVLDTFVKLDSAPTVSQSLLISTTLLQPGPTAANELLNVVAGENDAFVGADDLTASLRQLGLVNTFMLAPYNEKGRPGRSSLETPANTRTDLVTDADPVMQTTAEDMGTLLAMLYYCAQENGGALRALYADSLTQDECRQILEILQHNKIGSLIEEGVPPDTPVAHRHGWVNDTHGDGGIVFSPAGDYVIVMFMFKRDWLEWEVSSPLMAELSRAAYNYFNFEQPYLEGPRAN